MKSPNSVAIVCSAGGSVIDRVAAHDPGFAAALALVVTDRPCGAEEVAQRHGVKHIRISAPGRIEFSDRLLEHLREYEMDFAFLFFTRLLGGEILAAFRDRLINFHPSLLPACPGLHGFHDTIESGALLCGSTVHFVDEGEDTGPIIQQTFVPVNPSSLDEAALRHRIFLHQCASLSQVTKWATEGRLKCLGGRRATVLGARYDDLSGFVPALESEASLRLAKGTSP